HLGGGVRRARGHREVIGAVVDRAACAVLEGDALLDVALLGRGGLDRGAVGAGGRGAADDGGGERDEQCSEDGLHGSAGALRNRRSMVRTEARSTTSSSCNARGDTST